MLSAKQIEIFYEVYKHASMTAAAQSLEISQPSISKTLGVIEKNLNFKLFLRKGKKLVPTHEADDLFEHASVVHSQLKSFNAIVNPPQGCILAVGASSKRAIIVDDKIEMRTMMDVNLSCDHRVVDGAVGALFLNAFKKYMESPVLMFI